MVRVVPVEHLQIAAFFVEHALQPVLLHQRQNGDVVFDREGKFHVPRPVGLEEKSGCYRNDKQLHLLQLAEKLLTVERGLRFLVAVNGAVLGFQDIGEDFLGIGGQIRRVAGEVDAGLSLRTGTASGSIGKLHIVHSFGLRDFLHFIILWMR